MEIRENLELVEVEYENNGQKATLTFLDKERAEIREVNWNKQVYVSDSKRWIDNAEKAEKVETWANTFFNCSFDELPQVVGTAAAFKNVYIYDRYNSLWEVAQTAKFDRDMVGRIYESVIDEIVVDNLFIRIKYTIDGDRYETKFSMCKYVESLKQYFPDPNKKDKAIEKFEDKFDVGIEEKDSLIGKKILIEVKSAFGKAYFGDIKNMPTNKKKK